MPLMATPYFGFVEQKQFRFWQPHTAATLADLARSVSHVSTMKEHDRARVLAKVPPADLEICQGVFDTIERELDTRLDIAAPAAE